MHQDLIFYTQHNIIKKIFPKIINYKQIYDTWDMIRITFRMAPPLFHSFLQKGIYQSSKLDTILFYFEWKSGGAIRKLFQKITHSHMPTMIRLGLGGTLLIYIDLYNLCSCSHSWLYKSIVYHVYIYCFKITKLLFYCSLCCRVWP